MDAGKWWWPRFGGLVALLTIGGWACSPAPAPQAAPAAPAAPSGPEAQRQQAWDATVAAARNEGALAVSGPPGAQWREVMTSFQQDYPGIALEYTPVNSRDFWPKVTQERQGEQFLWDVRVGGSDPLSFRAKAEGFFDPLRPQLVLPEVIDDSKWLGGLDGSFVDNEKQFMLSFVAYSFPAVYVNRAAIPPADFDSADDLLDARWKGKIVLQDPRGGAAVAVFQTLLEAYGESFIRQLLTSQDVIVTSDVRQQAEWLVRGRYPIAIALKFDELIPFEQAGVTVQVEAVPQKLGTLTNGFGGVSLMSRAPHPKAAQVFINWLLTREVQGRIARTILLNSRRLDVEIADPTRAIEPARLDEYLPTPYEDRLPSQSRVVALAAELLK